MKRTVLVVDDNEMNRNILHKLLSKEYTVVEADNGKEALDFIRSKHQMISVILLDLIMPVMDGYEVLEEMYMHPMLSQIPVIVTTGKTEKAAEKKARELGATDYVTKPFDVDMLKRRISNIIKLRETAAMVNILQRDKLTRLWNRETFFDKAAWNIARQSEGYYVLACIDIDNFKVINDQYGMEKGDEVLKVLAGVLQKDYNTGDSLCGRISADNFIVLHPRYIIEREAETLKRHETLIIDNLAMPVTLSTGRYIVEDKNLSISSMYDRASMAQATVKGRYDVHVAEYDETMRNRILFQQTIVDEMRLALADGQFEAWFQPQYNHATGALIGAEALARWKHPARGIISPGEFIPIFEQNGFIYELDKYICEQVCGYLRRWINEGRSPLPVSVNISRYDLFRVDVVDVLIGLTNKYEISPELLRLEITESAFTESTEHVVKVVKELIDNGFTVEIDDFGSGYSSLNTLKDVPAQILKLDMRFLEDSSNSGRGGNIVEAVVRMSKWLGLAVIAEGVEAVEEADYLSSIVCNYVQGYLYAKPMPVEEYEALAKDIKKEEKLMVTGMPEEADSSGFWDPKSMDTLIFNSYVGAAFIFEYNEGKTEVIRANEKFAHLFGDEVSLEQVTELPWDDCIDPQSAEERREAIHRAIDTGKEVENEALFHDLLGDGQDIYLHSVLRVIASAEGRHLFYCYSENTTAQRESEQNERKLSLQLQAIMENMNGGISAVTVSANGELKYQFTNKQYYSIYGYTKEQFETELDSPFDVIHPDDLDEVKEKIAELLRLQKPTSYKYRVYNRCGDLMVIRTDSSVMHLEGIKEQIILTVTTDITELALAETDALTGALNRAVFEYEMNNAIEKDPDFRHAFLLMDIDGFKMLNDTFGHATGDQALADIAGALRTVIRKEDLLGRLGGDEFGILLKRVPDNAFIEKKAKDICDLVRKAYSMDVQISTSIGIAICPGDGENFKELYPKADSALYRVKEIGKNNYALYSSRMKSVDDEDEGLLETAHIMPALGRTKRRMLIVDGDQSARETLSSIFGDEFVIDTAHDGNAALMRLRHYGTAISIVLLDLIMPGLDGFKVLEKMQDSMEMRLIPVVAISDKSDRDISLKAINYGASDFVTKPIDPDLIRLRVKTALSKAENEKLRAQNGFLLLQNDENARYRAALEQTGTVVIEHDWISGAFTCDQYISKYIAGNYDGRKLWKVFLSDMVADVSDVKKMQDFIRKVANNRICDEGSMKVKLKIPSGQKHWFLMDVIKRKNEFKLTDKIIMIFRDIDDSEKAE